MDIQTLFNEITERKVKYFMDFAELTAKQSKYDGRQVGCVIVSNDANIVSHGCNGYPRYVNDFAINKLNRDDRLKLTIHAEENAIYRLNSLHSDVSDYYVFTTHFPCIHCASILYSKGFRKVVYKDSMSDFTGYETHNKHLYAVLKGMEFIHYDNDC